MSAGRPPEELDNFQNTGLIIEQKPEDFVLGSSSIPFEQRNVTKDWRKFRSRPERQNFTRVDPMNCVSHTSTNLWEAQANWMLENNLWPQESLDFFNKHGYIVNGKFEISERFQAKVSNTTTGGNSYQRVLDTMNTSPESSRGFGVVPEALWPSTLSTENFNWAEYYKAIPQELLNLAKESKEHFKFPYEAIHSGTQDNIKEIVKKALEHAPLGFAIATCQPYDASVQVCSNAANHAVTNDCFTTSYLIWDSYDPYEKYLEPGYLIHYVVKAVLYPLKKKIPSDGLFHEDIVFGDKGDEVLRLRKALNSIGWKNDIDWDIYDSGLCTVVKNFQLANLKRQPSVAIFLGTIFNLAGKRFGPQSREALNFFLSLK